MLNDRHESAGRENAKCGKRCQGQPLSNHTTPTKQTPNANTCKCTMHKCKCKCSKCKRSKCANAQMRKCNQMQMLQMQTLTTAFVIPNAHTTTTTTTTTQVFAYAVNAIEFVKQWLLRSEEQKGHEAFQRHCHRFVANSTTPFLLHCRSRAIELCIGCVHLLRNWNRRRFSRSQFVKIRPFGRKCTTKHWYDRQTHSQPQNQMVENKPPSKPSKSSCANCADCKPSQFN